MGSGNIPVEEDQKYGVKTPSDVVLLPTTSPSALMSFAEPHSPPSVSSWVTTPDADQMTARSASIDRGTGNLDRTRKIAALIGSAHSARACIDLLDLPLAIDDYPAHRHQGLRNMRGAATYDAAVTRDGPGLRGCSCFERRQKLGAGPRRVPCRRLMADVPDNDLAVCADRMGLSDIAVAAEQSRSACNGPEDGVLRRGGCVPDDVAKGVDAEGDGATREGHRSGQLADDPRAVLQRPLDGIEDIRAIQTRPTITVPASLIPSGWAPPLPLREGRFMRVAKGAGPFGGFWTPAARPTYAGPRPSSGRAAKHPIAVATAILVLIWPSSQGRGDPN